MSSILSNMMSPVEGSGEGEQGGISEVKDQPMLNNKKVIKKLFILIRAIWSMFSESSWDLSCGLKSLKIC